MISSARLVLLWIALVAGITATSPDGEEAGKEEAIEDLKDLLYTSMHNIVSLNDLVTDLSEKIALHTISSAETTAEMKISKAEAELTKATLSREIENLKKEISRINDDLKSKTCNKDCKQDEVPLDGDWTCWSDWSECSAECDGGTQNRNRTCTNPAPAHGGVQCEGEAEETRECSTDLCPADGGWSDYGDWSTCSAQCDGGTQSRSRTCNNPVPANGGADCQGDAEETRSCNTDPCPDQCPSSHPNVYYNGQFCCQSNREKFYSRHGTRCNGSVIQRDSLCCEGDKAIRCPGASGYCESYNQPGTAQ